MKPFVLQWKALEIDIPDRVKVIRTIMSELTGSSHMNYSGHLMEWTLVDKPATSMAYVTGNGA